jgi:hypothetical protein
VTAAPVIGMTCATVRKMSLEELHYARDLTEDARKIDKITQQLQWLATFIKRWEKATREPAR